MITMSPRMYMRHDTPARELPVLSAERHYEEAKRLHEAFRASNRTGSTNVQEMFEMIEDSVNHMMLAIKRIGPNDRRYAEWKSILGKLSEKQTFFVHNVMHYGEHSEFDRMVVRHVKPEELPKPSIRDGISLPIVDAIRDGRGRRPAA